MTRMFERQRCPCRLPLVDTDRIRLASPRADGTFPPKAFSSTESLMSSAFKEERFFTNVVRDHQLEDHMINATTPETAASTAR